MPNCAPRADVRNEAGARRGLHVKPHAHDRDTRGAKKQLHAAL